MKGEKRKAIFFYLKRQFWCWMFLIGTRTWFNKAQLVKYEGTHQFSSEMKCTRSNEVWDSRTGVNSPSTHSIFIGTCSKGLQLTVMAECQVKLDGSRCEAQIRCSPNYAMWASKCWWNHTGIQKNQPHCHKSAFCPTSMLTTKTWNIILCSMYPRKQSQRSCTF